MKKGRVGRRALLSAPGGVLRSVPLRFVASGREGQELAVWPDYPTATELRMIAAVQAGRIRGTGQTFSYLVNEWNRTPRSYKSTVDVVPCEAVKSDTAARAERRREMDAIERALERFASSYDESHLC